MAMVAGTLALAGWSGRPAQADPPSTDPKVAVTATGLPAGWTAVPIGRVPDDIDEKQSVSVDNNGVWTIMASGKDLWNSDDGGLLVYQMHTGDGSVSFHILGTQTGGQDAAGSDTGWVKDAAGFREALDSASRDVHISATSANDVEPAVRVNAGETPKHPGDDGSNGVGFNGAGGGTKPDAGHSISSGIWVGIERQGDNFGYYWSDDGKLWNWVGAVNIALPQSVFAGVEASAHKDDPTDNSVPVAVSKIDNVSVSNDLLSPHAVTHVTATPMDGAALVTWNAVTDTGATFNVYQYTMLDLSDAKKVNTDPLKTSSFMVTGLTNGQPYHFAVSAVLNGKEGAKTPPEPGRATGAAYSSGIVVPAAPIPALGGLALYNIGTESPGTVSLTSGTDLASAAIHMKASGVDIWEESDGFSFLAMPMAGDLDVSARFVKGPTEDADGGGWELGGPMFRETLDVSSRFAMAQLAATNDLQFKRRDAFYALPTNTDLSGTGGTARPVTMRLVRKGDVFQAYFSTDNGATWKDFGDPKSTDPTMSSIDTIKGFAKTPYVGIALSGHTEGEFSEADIDHIVIKPAQ
jgi:Fibronectin type III domain